MYTGVSRRWCTVFSLKILLTIGRKPKNRRVTTTDANLYGWWQIDRVKFYKTGEEVIPGMVSKPSPGHTPGHNGIEFTSKGQTMLVWGDLMHNHTLQMLDPEIAIEFDSDPKQARASRQDALKDAATRKIWIAGAHMPFPGIGHIRAESNGATLGCRWNIPRSKSTAKCNNLTKTDRTFLRGSRQMTTFLCYGDFPL